MEHYVPHEIQCNYLYIYITNASNTPTVHKSEFKEKWRQIKTIPNLFLPTIGDIAVFAPLFKRILNLIDIIAVNVR